MATAPGDPALIAALAGRYRIEREIGRGGMATVYLAQDLKHERQVAIKLLREDLSASLGKERFLREIRVAAALQHSHVLPLFDSGEAGGLLFYVMPYVDGPSLRDKLTREGELPIPDAVRILRDVADALSEAHRHGIVHRDLKPENVMLRGRHALVTDFGVAKALSDATGQQSLTTVGVALGTPTYMAPEQAVADPNVDHRADIYAFGVMAYEMLTGRPPFTGMNAQQILAAHVTAAAEPVTAHRAVPPALASLVMRCLEKKPADRWQSAEAMIPELEAVLTPSGGITPAATAPLPTKATAAVPGRRRSLAIAGALLVVVAAAAAWRTLARKAPVAASADGSLRQIAVLPFENIGGDTANAYFADGMTDELANVLARVPKLKVASRTSSYAFRDAKTRDIHAIQDALHVGALLEGTVSRSGDQLRVSARLTNTADGVEIWSDAFVRKASDIFAVQNEVARAIVSALASALGGSNPPAPAETARGTDDPTAYDLYLRARHLWFQRGIGPLRQAIALYRQAAGRDPKFARAFAGSAMARVALADYEASGSAEMAGEIERGAARALALDSTLAEPHLALAYLRYNTWRPVEAEQEFRRAIALEPRSAITYSWYAALLVDLGRLDEAIAQSRTAIELDPLSAIIAANAANRLSLAGRDSEALAMGDRAIALDPKNALVRFHDASVLARAGRAREALEQLDEAARLGLPPGRVVNRRVPLLLALGDTVKARAAVSEAAAALGGAAATDAGLAAAYAALGDREKALATLEAAVAARNWGMGYPATIMALPAWATLRSDPRFTRAMSRLMDGS